MTNKTKELVAAGHALAKELHCAESAALVRELATQLDVQLARSNALAAENAGLKKVPATDSETMLLALDAFNTHGSMRPDVGLQQAINVVMQRRETPATDTFLAEVRAQAVEMFAKEMHADISGDDAREFAAQLRKGAAS